MSYRLRSCVWEITLACCFSCKYCGSKAGRARENELTTEECLRVADELAALGCRRVSMIGGEVFLRPDWDEIALRLKRNGVRTAIITNGFLFKPEHIERIKAAGIESVAVSIDGPQRVHDEYRQQGSFLRAVRAIDTLSENGVPTTVITTLNAENAPLLEELYSVLRTKPIKAWQIQACSPMGNASEGVDHRFNAAAVIEFIERHLDEAPFPMGAADNIGYFTEGESRLRGRREGGATFTGCRAGLSAIGIDSVGNVRGCESMYDKRFIEGNLRERSLKDIWEDPEAFAYNRKYSRGLLTGACAECPNAGRCAGGCRSYNYFVHGNMYEAPYCVSAKKPAAPEGSENMNDEELKWKTNETRLALHTRVFDVLFREEVSAAGMAGEYVALKGPECVVIIPEHEGKFVLVRQWRHGAQKLTTEFPGGVIDAGEDPETAARRELFEETGYLPGRMTLLGSCNPNPALFESRFYCFLASELTPTGRQKLDADELVSVFERDKDKVIAEFGGEDMCHAFMGTALAFYLRHMTAGGSEE